MPTGKFTVDAALLRELGERLVGHPHVAVVELIKNAYDADARSVEVHLGADSITVVDDGHGISDEDFEQRWLRIGSTHKEKERESRELRRPLTGQKGVGRLAVQFLGRTLSLDTVSGGSSVGMHADIDWDQALQAGELTKVQVEYGDVPATDLKFASGRPHGVRLIIGKVAKSVLEGLAPKKLAEKLWALQAPRQVVQEEQRFAVRVFDASGAPVSGFDDAMQAHLRQWHALVRGSLRTAATGGEGTLHFTLEFDDHERFEYSQPFPACWVHSVEFDVRVFSLHGRLKEGVRVSDFRKYLDEYGGVRIFDAGFQLPFYGERESDWLGIERDHSHRLTESKFLPEELQVTRGLNFLPTTSRLLGVVKVDTGVEARWVRGTAASDTSADQPPLSIAITRDRLIQNEACRQLCKAVRTAIDYYAMKEASRELTAKSVAAVRAPVQTARAAIVGMQARVRELADRLPGETARDFQRGLDDILEATQRVEDVRQVEAALLGTLATAGLLTLVQQHEMGKQLTLLEEIVANARNATSSPGEPAWIARLESWIERGWRTQRLFAAYLEPDNRMRRQRLPVRRTLTAIVDAVLPLLRGVPVGAESLPTDRLLPTAALAEWTAIFQNVLLNAVNAIVASGRPGQIRLSWAEVGRKHSLHVEDTGVGIDLEEAPRYFRAFERALPGRAGRDAALGGSGLGLTIVRIVADRIGCRTTFVEPSAGYATAFELAWDE